MKYTAIIPSFLLAAGLSHAVPTLIERDAQPFVCSSIGRQLCNRPLTLFQEEGSGYYILKITTQGG